MHILLIGSACKIGEELIHALEGRHHNVCVSHASQPDVLHTNYDTLRTFDTIIYLVNEDALPLGTLQGESVTSIVSNLHILLESLMIYLKK